MICFRETAPRHSVPANLLAVGQASHEALPFDELYTASYCGGFCACIFALFCIMRSISGDAIFEVIFMQEKRRIEIPQPNRKKAEKPIPDVYPVIDNDLARDNIENNIPAADLEDL
jgi:hypothetical protein